MNTSITGVETQSINLLRLSKSLLCLVSCIHNTALLVKAFLTDSSKVKFSTDQVDLSPFTVKPSLIFYFLSIWHFLPDPESNSKIQTLQRVLLFLKVISVPLCRTWLKTERYKVHCPETVTAAICVHSFQWFLKCTFEDVIIKNKNQESCQSYRSDSAWHHSHWEHFLML